MLEIYGDESFKNTPGFQGCYALAGYLTDLIIWSEIDQAWEIVKNQRPAIQYFKMREYWERSGQFEKFTKEEADTKYELFLEVLEVYGKKLAWIDSIITHDCFNAAVKGRPLTSKIFNDPYIFCLIGVFRLVTGALRVAIGESNTLPLVDFVFDEKRGLEHHVLEIHQFLKQNGERWPILNRISFEDDRSSNPLQCADLLAWHVRRNYVRPAEDKGKALPGYSRLECSAYKRWSGLWKEQELKDWLNQFESRRS